MDAKGSNQVKSSTSVANYWQSDLRISVLDPLYPAKNYTKHMKSHLKF